MTIFRGQFLGDKFLGDKFFRGRFCFVNVYACLLLLVLICCLSCSFEYEEHIDFILRQYYGDKSVNLGENLPGPYSFVSYCRAMLQPGAFGDVLMLSMFSRMLNAPITCIHRGKGFDHVRDPADRWDMVSYLKSDGTVGKRKELVVAPEHLLKEHYRFNREFRLHHDVRLDEKFGDKHFIRVVLAFNENHRHYDACGKSAVFYSFRWMSSVRCFKGTLCNPIVLVFLLTLPGNDWFVDFVPRLPLKTISWFYKVLTIFLVVLISKLTRWLEYL